MRTVWRITTARLAATAFSGEGARWNPKGLALGYMAESRALALLEMMVLDAPLRARCVLIPAQLPDTVCVTIVEVADLLADWRRLDRRDALQRVGRDWLESGHIAMLAVLRPCFPPNATICSTPVTPTFPGSSWASSRRWTPTSG